MKWYLLIPLVMAMLITNAAFCQEFEEREEDIALERGFDNPEHQMHMRRMEMQIRQEEAEMDFQQQMRELELQSRRIDLENAEIARAHKLQAGKMKLEKAEKDWAHSKSKEDMHPLLLICFIVHILTAIWVFQDIRKRGAGSGLWIVIALLTGLIGTLVYAVVRLGEKQT
jgi:hypothetical protein